MNSTDFLLMKNKIKDYNEQIFEVDRLLLCNDCGSSYVGGKAFKDIMNFECPRCGSKNVIFFEARQVLPQVFQDSKLIEWLWENDDHAFDKFFENGGEFNLNNDNIKDRLKLPDENNND